MTTRRGLGLILRPLLLMFTVLFATACEESKSADKISDQTSKPLRMLRIANTAWKYTGESDLVVLQIADKEWRAFYQDKVVDFQFEEAVTIPPAIFREKPYDGLFYSGAPEECQFVVSSDAGILFFEIGGEEALRKKLKEQGLFSFFKRAIESLKLAKRDLIRDVFVTENRETCNPTLLVPSKTPEK